MKKLKSIIFIFTFLTYQVMAQPTDEEQLESDYFDDWFQVEIIIFENLMSQGILDQEQWPKNIALAYPPDLQFLEESPDETQDEESNAPLDQTEFIDTLEKPFIVLSDESHNLKNEVKRLNRSNNYNILFHKSWRQPISDEQPNPAIVITGGDKFEDHFELEGTIRINKGRYLHAQTNLWLTRFAANFGQEDKHWPNLPQIPNLDFEEARFSDFSPNINIDVLDDNKYWFDNNSKYNFESDYNLDSIKKSKSDSKYVIDRVVTFKQSRRMRSNELHYIDNPKVGLLIIINRYIPPSL